MNQFIDVVVPTMNRCRYLEFCLKSILNQTHKDFVIHVLDNNSSDNTQEVINQLNDKRIISHKTEKTLTLEENWSRANNLINSDYFIRIDDDNIIRPDFFEVALKELTLNKADVISFNNEIIDFSLNKKTMFYPCNRTFIIDDIELFYFTFNNIIDSNYSIYKVKTLRKFFQNKIYCSELPDRNLDYKLAPLVKSGNMKFLYSSIIAGTTCFRAYNNVPKFKYIPYRSTLFNFNINFKGLSNKVMFSAFEKYEDDKYKKFYSNLFKNLKDIPVFMSQIQDFRVYKTTFSDKINSLLDLPNVLNKIISQNDIIYYGKSKIYLILDVLLVYKNVFSIKKTLKGYTEPSIVFAKKYGELPFNYNFTDLRNKILFHKKKDFGGL